MSGRIRPRLLAIPALSLAALFGAFGGSAQAYHEKCAPDVWTSCDALQVVNNYNKPLDTELRRLYARLAGAPNYIQANDAFWIVAHYGQKKPPHGFTGGHVDVLKNAFDSSAIQTNAVGAKEIKKDAVGSDEIKKGAVGNSELAKLSVSAPQLMPNSVLAAKLADNAVTGSKIADNAVTGSKIADNTVALRNLAPNSVDGSKIADGSVGNADLAPNSVDGSKIADGSVGNADLADNSVDGSKVSDGSLAGADVAPGTFLGGAITVRREDIDLESSGAVGVIGPTAVGLVDCPSGATVIGGGAEVDNDTEAEVVGSRPATTDTVPGGLPDNGDGFGFWQASGRSTTNVAHVMRVWAICAKVP